MTRAGVWEWAVRDLPRRGLAWLRVQRWYLLGILLLGPIAVWLNTSEAWSRYAERERVWPTRVAKGASGEYAGASWRLLSIAKADRLATSPDRSIPLPRGLSIVHVRLEMTAKTLDALEKLRMCQGTLSDRKGRRWEAESPEVSRRAKVFPAGCTEGINPQTRKRERAAVGQPWVFEQAYLVPGDAVDDVTPEMTLARERPRYLRFAR